MSLFRKNTEYIFQFPDIPRDPGYASTASPSSPWEFFIQGLLKKAASGVRAIFPCSRIASTLRAQKWLWPCWTTFLNRPKASDMHAGPGYWHLLLSSLFNTPIQPTSTAFHDQPGGRCNRRSLRQTRTILTRWGSRRYTTRNGGWISSRRKG